jgi:two-component system chemotaxis response regulator CheY
MAAMKVLIVDDSEAPLKYLEKVISGLGHEVVGVAHNGEEAVAAFRTHHPDAVFMDMIMPRMNGLEALQAIRAADPDARVVMTCSLKSCEMAFVSEDQGARYFLTKPFEEECLRKILSKLSDEVKDAGTPADRAHASASAGTPQIPPPLPSIRRNRPPRHATVS